MTEHAHQPLAPASRPAPEDRAGDDLQRDALRGGTDGGGLPQRPALDLRARGLGHHLGVVAHALAVERRQHELALAHVGGVVEEQHRLVPEQRQQDPVGLAGVQQPRIAGEHLLDRVGVGEEDPGALVGDLHGEHVAVAAVKLLHHRGRPHEPTQGLNGARPRWAGR